jgi:hypothetical protein
MTVPSRERGIRGPFGYHLPSPREGPEVASAIPTLAYKGRENKRHPRADERFYFVVPESMLQGQAVSSCVRGNMRSARARVLRSYNF